jgi:hypothetical protein
MSLIIITGVNMKPSELTNEQADYLCAKAQGWVEEIDDCGSPYWFIGETYTGYSSGEYTPSTNPVQWGELIEKYGVALSPVEIWWGAEVFGSEYSAVGDTPGRAVVNAIIASVYGDRLLNNGENV